MSNKKILAISGSLREGSSNTALLRAAATLTPENVEFTIFTGLADLPHFTPELDPNFAPELAANDLPAPVKTLRALLQDADGVLICTPEYAFGMPGSLKNALDWVVSSGELWHKPVAAISASPSASGGAKAHTALLLTLTALEAEIVEEGSLIVPSVRTKLNQNGEVSDPATAQALQATLDALLRAVTAQQAEQDSH